MSALRVQAVESDDVVCRYVVFVGYRVTGVVGSDRVFVARNRVSVQNRSVAII